MMFDSLYTIYDEDAALLRSLGIAIPEKLSHGEMTNLGIIVVEPAETATDDQPARPAATVNVRVCALPAKFWEFTITRPREESSDYEPVEVIELSTGSGSFAGYWPTARLFAQRALVLK